MPDLELEIQSFFSDNNLRNLIEIQKNSDNPFSAISHYENQHSDIISWLFNSQESHGQGDLILKDFMIAIYKRSQDGVFGKGGNRDFREKWTPGAIANSNFNSAITLREYCLDNENKNRIDILIIDPENRFIIAIENKSGTRHRQEQLSRYLESIKQIKAKNTFRGFLTAYVALDQNYSIDEESENKSGVHDEHSSWLSMDYSWLRGSAEREELLSSHKKHTSAFIKSYCHQQGVYSPKTTEFDITEKLAEIAEKHNIVIEELRNLRNLRIFEPKTWTPSSINKNTSEGQLLLFYLKNKNICDQLSDITNLFIFDKKIRERHQYITDENIDRYKTYFSYRTKYADNLPTTDELWPLFIRVKQVNENYSVRLVARTSFAETEQDNFRKLFPKGRKDTTRKTPEEIYPLEKAIDKFSSFEEQIRCLSKSQ